MGQAVAYSDIPEGFQVGAQQPQTPQYSDIPQGFQIGGQPQPESTSFLGGMWQNLKNAGQSASDLYSGNYEGINSTRSTPKTEALADKLFPQGTGGQGIANAAGDFLLNARNTSPSDWSGALLEKFGDTAEGKVLNVIGGIHPLYNAVGSAINQANPVISKATGIAPENLQLAELAAPAVMGARAMAMGATIPDDFVTNYVKGKASDLIADESTTGANKLPSYGPDQIKAAAQTAYKNSETMPGKIPIGQIRQSVQQMLANKDIGQQTVRGQAFSGENPVTDTMTKLQESVKDNSPWTTADANEIHDAISNDIQKARSTGDYDSARKLGIIKNSLRDTYNSYADANPQNAAGFNEWLRGDKLYSASMRGQEIQDIIENAQKADVPSTAIKNGFKTFVKNDDNKVGLTDDEWDAANYAAKHGLLTAGLKNVGSRLAGHIAGTGAGLAAGGPLGAVAGDIAGQLTTAPLRAWANARQAGRGQGVLDQISQRPVVQEALNPNYKPPLQPLAQPQAPTGIAAPLIGGAIEQKGTPANPLSDTNLQKLQSLKNQMQQTRPQPQSNASDFFKKEAQAESNNNPSAKNPNSSASGSFQFTDGTWKQMVKRYGSETGINLADKEDPKAQEVMAKLYAKDNISRMQPFLQRLPTKGELYQAHVLGADGALRLISVANNTPDKQSLMMFPKAVTTANRSLFFDKSGKPLTAAQTYTLLSQKVT